MPRPLPRERWLADAAERFTALDAWRQAHPKATWNEIAAAIEAELGPLRAQMLGATAMASEAAELRGERPVCPACGKALVGGRAPPPPLTRRAGCRPESGTRLRPLPGLPDRGVPPG